LTQGGASRKAGLLALGYFLSPVPGFGLLYSFRNSFHSATPWALRMSTDTGSSFGARGALSSFRPASCGRGFAVH